jgi:hypothetical protein
MRTTPLITWLTRAIVAALYAGVAVPLAKVEGFTGLPPVVIGGLVALLGLVTTIIVEPKRPRALHCASCGQPIHDDEGYRFDPGGRMFHLRCSAPGHR